MVWYEWYSHTMVWYGMNYGMNGMAIPWYGIVLVWYGMNGMV